MFLPLKVIYDISSLCIIKNKNIINDISPLCIIENLNTWPSSVTGAYKTHLFKLQLDLGPHDVVPETFERYCHVEYNMPNSTVSRAQIRSISVSENPESTDKWVHHLAKYEYRVEMEQTDTKQNSPEYVESVKSPASPESPIPESDHTPPEVDADKEDSSSSSSDEE